MADQPMTELAVPEPAPALDSLTAADDDSRLKSEIIDELFGVPELAEPDPEPEPDPGPSRASLRTSLEEEGSPEENLDSVALNLEHALSEVFGEVEGASGGSGGGSGGGGADGGAAGDATGAATGAAQPVSGDINCQPVSNGQVESSHPPKTMKEGQQPPPAPADTAADDDDIVVLDEVIPAPSASTATKRRLRGPASKRKDFARLGPPSSRMPPVEAHVSSDSEIEVEQTWRPQEIKMMHEARRLKVGVDLRLNNVCQESSQTVRQWSVTLQQRRDARKSPQTAGAMGRGRAMVQIPASSLQRAYGSPTEQGRTASIASPHLAAKPSAGAAELAAIPDLGEKQRSQLMKLLKGNNGTSISAASVAPPRTLGRPPNRRRGALPRPAPPPIAPAPAPAPKPDTPQTIPPYCYTTSGNPDDLFSVYLSAPQQPENCFVNMQVNNQCLKVRLPPRPAATGMVFAQVMRSTMEPICEVMVDSSVFIPPPPSCEQPGIMTSRPGPKSRQVQPAQHRAQHQLAQPQAQQQQQKAQQEPAVNAYGCSKCSQRFPTSAMLEYHFSVFHQSISVGDSRDVIQCPMCTHWRGPALRLRTHVAVMHHPGTNRNFSCSICGRAWNRRAPGAHDQWLRHIMDHAQPASTAAVPQPRPPRREGARAQPTAFKQFQCPQCRAVFPDVSLFPAHWLKVHAGGSSSAAPVPVACPAGAAQSAPAQRKSAAQESRFAARFESNSTTATPTTSTAAATPSAGDEGSLRCTRCGEVFPNEPAYAQHWINAHTRVKLSAEQQAAASRAAAAAASAPAAGPASAAAAPDSSSPPPPPEPTETTGSAPAPSADGEQAPSADGEKAPSADGGQEPSAATDDSVMDVSENTAPTGPAGEVLDSAAMDTSGNEPPADVAMDGVSDEGAVPPTGTENGALTGPVPPPLDPADEVANLVPSDADFEMSEETLDRMLEQIVPVKNRK
ncbi:Zinc finger and BTB domain-containing protein 40 [Amphibalanus amphitrite]|uniref:Zinc finger and BTB domain-containing protein 40 n=1 Tax=Amphibalanus amphitrite TaxID=1232801 RepID=A0A6A4WQ59_AMPAM|nr:Zinc finger and BTB domain-containing protein 40 [Amphibalanus amphitrite]